jgi:zinc metalloprotease ZmpB
VAGHECLLMIVSADGDRSNTETVRGPIPHWRLVPFDNNMAQRNVAPVPGGAGSGGLADAFKERHFWANNPYNRTVTIVIESRLPDFLQQRNWGVRFSNPEGEKFELKAGVSTEVIFSLEGGGDFKSSDVEKDATIEMLATIDGLVVGGMTYYIDPKMNTVAVER